MHQNSKSVKCFLVQQYVLSSALHQVGTSTTALLSDFTEMPNKTPNLFSYHKINHA